MAKTKTQFTVYVDVKLNLGVRVKAETFEEAIAAARQIKVLDVVELDEDTDHNDSEIEVTGVYK